MNAPRVKKAREVTVEELQPGSGLVELTASESEDARGGAFGVAFGGGSVASRSYLSAGPIVQETL